jgi:hypothetical protein
VVPAEQVIVASVLQPVVPPVVQQYPVEPSDWETPVLQLTDAVAGVTVPVQSYPVPTLHATAEVAVHVPVVLVPVVPVVQQ